MATTAPRSATSGKATVSGNIRVAGGGSNVVENVESSHSSNRGIWVQSQQLVVSGGSYHHNDAGKELPSRFLASWF